ncbi:hypothetical protein CXK86_01505 [Paenibacillus sp. BGI2013]|uniref:glycoside hydrolase family 3 C-terminal domain-containing protein n=1 Tax=Paenibacillus sp. BGI2013 TaxID=2058902 RepID=UPI000C6E9C28|nr:glycoside hydrolase family 3 C-terminal domain-containing protein [Paenibacillus sp. BGI2013]PKQ92823.1 hypothetical protein CXK86_01505 [Paenibacillus sp. BGI2013]
MVLLKNEEQLLPLAKTGKIALIGALSERVRYQGGGSSHVNPTKLDSIQEEIRKAASEEAEIIYAQGYDLDSDENDMALLNDAKRIASEAHTVVLFVGLPDRYESEGYDRTYLDLPANQCHLIEQVASVQPNIVMVLSNGAPVVMPWLGRVKAVLEAYLGGQALGGAIADLSFGDTNPSGKLAETFPQHVKHNPSHPFFPGERDHVEYREGLFVGYRYYEAKEIEPLFPFGYGLSYTTFEYSNLKLDSPEITDRDTLQVSLDVKNTGIRLGKETVQLYVRDVASSVIRPEKELKGFEKVELAPGETITVTFTLDKRSFAYYNVDLSDWHVESGEFELLIGSSSRDITLRASVTVRSTQEIVTAIHRNTTIGDLMANPKTALILQQLRDKRPELAPSDAVSSEMMAAMIRDLPLRTFLSLVGGG